MNFKQVLILLMHLLEYLIKQGQKLFIRTLVNIPKCFHCKKVSVKFNFKHNSDLM
jgi:hypothetical protein